MREPEHAGQESCIDRWKKVIAGQEFIQNDFRLACHQVQSDVSSDTEGNDVGSPSFGFLMDEETERSGGRVE